MQKLWSVSVSAKQILGLAVGLLAVSPALAADVHVFVGPVRPAYVRPSYYVYEPYPVYARPVYVRPRPVYVEEPVIVERPVYVERQRIVERPVVVERERIVERPVPAQNVAPRLPADRMHEVTRASVPTPTLQPIETDPAPPLPQSPPLPPPVVAESPVITRDVVDIQFKGKCPKGPTKPYSLKHYYTGAEFVVDIPAWMDIKKIEDDKKKIELKFRTGEIEIYYYRDGKVTVRYDF